MSGPIPFTAIPGGEELSKVLHFYNLDYEHNSVSICPFHDDNRPSLSINIDNGVFHCYACGVTGDAFEFVKAANPKLNGLESLLLYNKILSSDKVSNISIRKVSNKKRKMLAMKRETEIIRAHDYYFGLKTVDWRNVENEYKNYMLKRGFNEEVLNMCRAKLTIVNDNYPLIFPVFDMGEFRGYVLRTTNKRVEERAKYLYNEGFSRRDTLFGRYDNETVVVCEGYMDSLKLMQFGLKYVVSIFGWRATREQIGKLKARGVRAVINALDKDEYGARGGEILRKHFDVVDFAFPDGVCDPGDLTKRQFKIAYDRTKKMYRVHRRRNGNVVNTK